MWVLRKYKERKILSQRYPKRTIMFILTLSFIVLKSSIASSVLHKGDSILVLIMFLLTTVSLLIVFFIEIDTYQPSRRLNEIGVSLSKVAPVLLLFIPCQPEIVFNQSSCFITKYLLIFQLVSYIWFR